MLVNHDLKFVFMHAPKCAGIALSQWLVDHYGFEYYLNPDDRCPVGCVLERHRYTLPDELQGYEVITCIREPLERWESFFLYQTLQMGAELSFEQFTRDRLKWLPLQSHYTEKATYILRVDALDTEVFKLPFVRYPVPEIPRLNVSRQQSNFEQARAAIVWNTELRDLVKTHFAADLALFAAMS